jgi:hypothetical protein
VHGEQDRRLRRLRSALELEHDAIVVRPKDGRDASLARFVRKGAVARDLRVLAERRDRRR